MAGWLKRIFLPLGAVMLMLGLGGCGDDGAAQQAKEIEKYLTLTESRINTLGGMLDKGEIRNATLIAQYAERLKTQDASLAPIIDALSQDAARGPLYQSLVRRRSDALAPVNFVDEDMRLAELENLYQAADPILYNDMLSDPLNALADMSGGTLPRMNAISREAELAANGEDFGPGSQLVGNPTYGQWQTGSDGTSFWAWYGMYAMFSNLFHRPVYYDTWSGRRHYSYYNDVGRYRYSSPRDLARQQQVFTQAKKRFDSQGKRFDSPYAKTRSGASGLSRQSQQAPSVAQAAKARTEKQKFRSNYAKDSSFRDAKTRTSRSTRRGK
ncbi:hypothetical protein [Shewanella sp. FJAT-52076]|uniref:hypothetical protein n=1 Tax=Shewanella sp. FJAT-52076 TaxID=2864202 RepID=UPI001C6556EF|nr:hypothetical protein [Shewanella sp. FJAT-52076]QYJ74454.1 hypothetical protein K0H79_13960 [Shewanella sp. FJAT-52076]